MGARAPLTRNYQVAGTFKSGVYEYDSNLVFVTIEEAQKQMAMDDNEVSTTELMVDDDDKASALLDKA